MATPEDARETTPSRGRRGDSFQQTRFTDASGSSTAPQQVEAKSAGDLANSSPAHAITVDAAGRGVSASVGLFVNPHSICTYLHEPSGIRVNRKTTFAAISKALPPTRMGEYPSSNYDQIEADSETSGIDPPAPWTTRKSKYKPYTLGRASEFFKEMAGNTTTRPKQAGGMRRGGADHLLQEAMGGRVKDGETQAQANSEESVDFTMPFWYDSVETLTVGGISPASLRAIGAKYLNPLLNSMTGPHWLPFSAKDTSPLLHFGRPDNSSRSLATISDWNDDRSLQTNIEQGVIYTCNSFSAEAVKMITGELNSLLFWIHERELKSYDSAYRPFGSLGRKSKPDYALMFKSPATDFICLAVAELKTSFQLCALASFFGCWACHAKADRNGARDSAWARDHEDLEEHPRLWNAASDIFDQVAGQMLMAGSNMALLMTPFQWLVLENDPADGPVGTPESAIPGGPSNSLQSATDGTERRLNLTVSRSVYAMELPPDLDSSSDESVLRSKSVKCICTDCNQGLQVDHSMNLTSVLISLSCKACEGFLRRGPPDESIPSDSSESAASSADGAFDGDESRDDHLDGGGGDDDRMDTDADFGSAMDLDQEENQDVDQNIDKDMLASADASTDNGSGAGRQRSSSSLGMQAKGTIRHGPTSNRQAAIAISEATPRVLTFRSIHRAHGIDAEVFECCLITVPGVTAKNVYCPRIKRVLSPNHEKCPTDMHGFCKLPGHQHGVMKRARQYPNPDGPYDDDDDTFWDDPVECARRTSSAEASVKLEVKTLKEIRASAPQCRGFVPRFFGSFWVKLKEAFVYEDAGISLHKWGKLKGLQLNSVDIEALKGKIRETVKLLHKYGWLHGDLALRNICVRHRRADVASPHGTSSSRTTVPVAPVTPSRTPPRLSSNHPKHSPDADHPTSSTERAESDSSPFKGPHSVATTVSPGRPHVRSTRWAPLSIDLGQRGHLEVMLIDFSRARRLKNLDHSSFVWEMGTLNGELEDIGKR